MDWTDDRLQERFNSIDQRFDRVDRDIRDLRSEMNTRFAEMNTRFEGLQRAMIYGVIALSGSFIAGFAALIGLIATQL
jgi:hypothetical protein